jgi:hypothetical protein
MKTNPAETATLERMAPGVLSRDGFLGTDSRPIAEIVATDRAAFEEAGVAPEDAADVLEEIHEAADAALGTSVSLYGGSVTAQITEVRGRIPCPFADGVQAHKAVLDIGFAGHRIRVTPLGIHLLRSHCFLQGRAAPFRIEPGPLIELHELVRGPRAAG